MKAKHTTAISLKKVTKLYQLHHEKPTLIHQLFGLEKNTPFVALKNVSLELPVGDKLGIVGKNGSGKTTLLKIIAGITSPTLGNVTTLGKVVSLIDLTAGFHQDLSGFDNIKLNGLLLGMEKHDLQAKINSIIDFADIGQFIDAPLFTYSSGMVLRLGFAVAAHAEPDILILDEGVAVGDEAFNQKCTQYLKKVFTGNKTIITVSHNPNYLRENCTRILWLEKGKINQLGGLSVLDNYQKSFRQ